MAKDDTHNVTNLHECAVRQLILSSAQFGQPVLDEDRLSASSGLEVT